MYPNDTPNTNEILYGYCHCGCGEKTSIAKITDLKHGRIKGEPVRYIHNHHTRRPLAERFWEKVDVRGPDDCWEWTGNRLPRGYGNLQVGDKSRRATRVIWELLNGPIPDGLHICHRCDNPPCVNPSHLWLGTPSENSKDMFAKGRQNRGENQAKGESQGSSKLTADKVIEIRKRASGGEKITVLAREYGVRHTTIHKVVNRLSWRHIE